MRTMQMLKSSTTSVLGQGLVRPGISRRVCVRPAAQQNDDERKKYNVRKGKQFENKRRRKGREAHLRSAYDSPMRDGNRDRLIGLLTERAAKTLMIYLMETNANVYSWLLEFYKANPIPKNGSWDEISGEAFLRKLLSMPIAEAKFNTGRDSLFDNVQSCGVDPRSIAQRIMDIRTQLSEEFIQELQAIAEENSMLLRETLQTSLSTTLTTLDDPAAASAASKDGSVHPELADTPSSSSSSATKEQQGSSSKDAPSSTPPPSPVPGASKPKAEPIKGTSSSRSSSKKGSDAADKAATVAALNAALNKPTAPGSGSGSSSSRPAAAAGSSDTSSSSDDKVNMTEVLAQLRRAMEADVARDVLKMKENTAGSSSSSVTRDSSSVTGSSSVTSGSSSEETLAADASSSPTGPAGDSSSSSGLAPTAAEAAAVLGDTPAAADASAPAPAAAAADAVADSTPEDSPEAAAGEESSPVGSAAAVGSQLPNGSAVVGEAGTYSLMLPKGWGPRLGVGFSKYPRSRNNIVSSASLGSLSPKAGQTAGDALSGAAGEAV